MTEQVYALRDRRSEYGIRKVFSSGRMIPFWWISITQFNKLPKKEQEKWILIEKYW